MSITDLTMFGIFINKTTGYACWIDIYGPILNGSLFFAAYWLLYAFVGFVLYVDFVFLVALGDVWHFVAFCCVFVILSGISYGVLGSLWVFLAFCVVLRFSTYAF